MGAVEVELLAEVIEPSLLRKAGVSRGSRGLRFKGAMHAFMTTVLLRFAGLDELWQHPKAYPPSRELR